MDWYQNAFENETYAMSIAGKVGNEHFFLDKPDREVIGEDGLVTGIFQSISLHVERSLEVVGKGLCETVTINNIGKDVIDFDAIDIGVLSKLKGREDWLLCAIPFTVQLDGWQHVYSGKTLINGSYRHLVNGNLPGNREYVYGNSVYSDPTRLEPELVDTGRLRSEAWAWSKGGTGVLVIKYNNIEIEYSIAAPVNDVAYGPMLRMGGAGLCLYGEPAGALRLAAGSSYTFDPTTFLPFSDDIKTAHSLYRDFLEEKGHGFPPDYHPPLHWNVLYDIGWLHSEQRLLRERYTKETLLQEADKAAVCGCEALYLDPGWEFAEGTTLWDSYRLGDMKQFIAEIKRRYGLDVCIRTVLRCYIHYWPEGYAVMHKPGEPYIPAAMIYPDAPVNTLFWEICLCNESFWQEKLRRIQFLVQSGVRFIMFDDMDWRGACYNSSHTHSVPASAADHARSVFALAHSVKQRYPHVICEVHDPVWPWGSSRYMPIYFHQGFGDIGCYHENWGFEFMWNCINDLITGKALALYYYNLSTNIPLYLHISMAADNENCLFFWWVASTVRHLGIGGKESHPSVTPKSMSTSYDAEKRFDAYRVNMQIYSRLRNYFIRGKFTGISPDVHMHTLPGENGGVVNVFNRTDQEKTERFTLAKSEIGYPDNAEISGVLSNRYVEQGLEVVVKVAAYSHTMVTVGNAYNLLGMH